MSTAPGTKRQRIDPKERLERTASFEGETVGGPGEASHEKQMPMQEAERIRAALIEAEQSGFTTQGKEEMRQEFIDEMKQDGIL